MNTQHLSNLFNKKYIEATRTSEPQDYLAAVVLGRQLINELVQEGVVEDNFDEELLKQEGEL